MQLEIRKNLIKYYLIKYTLSFKINYSSFWLYPKPNLFDFNQVYRKHQHLEHQISLIKFYVKYVSIEHLF
jgi:hypothetical protein